MKDRLREVTKNFGHLRILKSVGMPLAFAVILAFSFLSNSTTASSPSITLRSATSANNAVATTLTLPVPAGAIPGDVLLASVDVENSPTITMPAGWVLARSDTNPGALHMVQANYVHVVTGSEPLAYTWTFSAAHGASGGILDYSGVDTASPVNATTGATTTTLATQITAPSANVSSPNSMLVSITGVGVTRTLTPSASMTSRYINGTSVDGEKTTILVADQLLSAAGATGTRATTFNSTATGVAQLIALRPLTITADTTPPSTPGGITQTSNTVNSITASWGPSLDNVGVTGYTVYQNNLPITTTTSTSYTFSSLACGTSYPLAVDAFDAAGNHSSQVTISGSTAACPDITPPSDPTGLAQQANTDTSITIGWNASIDSVGVIGYTIYQGGSVVATTTATNYNLTGLTCGNTYNLAVDAFDAAGNHSSQASINATTVACPNLPTVTITNPNSGSTVFGNQVVISASATDASGIASVQFWIDGNLLGSPITSAPFQINWDTTLFSDGQHQLSVEVTANNGNSANTFSSPLSVTVSNSVPVVDSVSINQASPMTNDVLSVTVNAHDPAGMSLTYSYQWFKNGANISGANGPTLNLSQAGNGNKGDAISLQVVANNGTFSSQPLTSNPVTVVNSSPSATVNLSTATPDTDATITATATVSDPDADPISLTYVWSVNGTVVKTTVTTSLTDNLDLSLVGNGNYGDGLKVQVTPNDGTANGSTVQATGTVTKPATGTIIEYSSIVSGNPGGIALGPDGNLWVSVEQSNFIEIVRPSGLMTTLQLPSTGNLGGITAGPDGNIWAAEFTANKIARITLAGVITEFAVPTPSGGFGGITTGADGNLWFVEGQGNKVGRITTSGVVTEFNVPTTSSFPHSIAKGPDGNVWFCEMNAGKIGKITPAGVVTEYKLPSATSKPNVINFGPDGNMWFTEQVGKIGRITPTGVITEFKLPNTSALPVGITTGPDGNIWFAEHTGGKIGRITPTGVITEFAVPVSTSQPDKMVTGPDGNLWFTEHSSGKIGRITP